MAVRFKPAKLDQPPPACAMAARRAMRAGIGRPLAVYLYLIDHADPRTAIARPSQKRMESFLGIARSTARRDLDALKAGGWIIEAAPPRQRQAIRWYVRGVADEVGLRWADLVALRRKMKVDEKPHLASSSGKNGEPDLVAQRCTKYVTNDVPEADGGIRGFEPARLSASGALRAAETKKSEGSLSAPSGAGDDLDARVDARVAGIAALSSAGPGSAGTTVEQFRDPVTGQMRQRVVTVT